MSAAAPSSRLLAVGRLVAVSVPDALVLEGGGGQAGLGPPHSYLWLAVAASQDRERALARVEPLLIERAAAERALAELLAEGWLLETSMAAADQALLVARGTPTGRAHNGGVEVVQLGELSLGLSRPEFALWSSCDGASLAGAGKSADIESDELWTVASSLVASKAAVLDWVEAR